MDFSRFTGIPLSGVENPLLRDIRPPMRSLGIRVLNGVLARLFPIGLAFLR